MIVLDDTSWIPKLDEVGRELENYDATQFADYNGVTLLTRVEGMSFGWQRQNWEQLAEKDPMWAVLSRPEKRNGHWDRDEFYATGLDECEEMLADLAVHDLPLERGSALDLGCGPGRITHALASEFEQVIGYDISATMLDMAAKDAAENESFLLNETDDLSVFNDNTFDLVYCSKVLQHVDEDRVGNYMRECVRVLRSGGTLFCQMLSHQTGWVGSAESSPDPEWGQAGGPPPHYTVISVEIGAMMSAWMELDVIIHQAKLVEGGRGQSIFTYDYIVQRRP